ncbi:MAG TPA: MarR family winged helix-turn-helix transcriptional regulator [Spirochaetota bacterium]|nr:MarR family winged helix-turn-helix transcriptional regulator [Spirochaetota bacterium]HOJ30115.1 MarR family winged helix-turn-helix transcriptional regulator [Spirochaetota bacterium]HOM11040.1 MarR family winged helix-turn-helix transcriptional regulator [Spirochaetota bacterium]HPP50838.1 MarR family winged helix-turn-helix transcriptional regulator [Spirochaetota bacterium]
MNVQNLDENLIAILDKLTDIKRSMLWKISEHYNLTPLQIQILQYINGCSATRNITPSDIVKNLYISKATASVALKTLQQKAMIRKNVDKHDSRSYYLTLTKKAENILTQIEQSKRDVIQFLENMSSNDKKAAFTVLTQLVTAMQNNGIIDYVALCINCEFCKNVKPHTFQCTVTGRIFEYDGINVGCCNFLDKRAV